MAKYVLQLTLILLFSYQVLGLQWCVLPSTVHVRQNETCLSFVNLADTKLLIHAMRGEEENRQLLLDTRGWGSKENLTNSVSLTFDTFKSSSGALVTSNPLTKWWQVGYVYCKTSFRYEESGGGWRPDPLFEPEGNEVYLESEVTQPLWVSVKVPRDLEAGTYTSVVMVKIQGPTSIMFNIPITLVVWNIVLPPLSEAKFPAIFSYNSNLIRNFYKTRGDAINKMFMDLLIDQRLAGGNIYTGQINWNDTDYMASSGVQWLPIYNINLYLHNNNDENYYVQNGLRGECVNYTEKTADGAVQFLESLVDIAQQKDILDKMFVYGFDETPKECEESIRIIYSALKKKWPKLRTVATINWDPSLDLPLDVWVISYHIANKTEASPWLKQGKQQWWYHCIVPTPANYLNTFIERPLIETRLLFWLGSTQDVGGWLYYAVVSWSSTTYMTKMNKTAKTGFDPANYFGKGKGNFVNGDGNFIYPGQNGPIPTSRLHNLRDGFEDAELFRMLPLNVVEPFLTFVIQSPTDYSLDPLLFEQQRIKIASLVEQFEGK